MSIAVQDPAVTEPPGPQQRSRNRHARARGLARLVLDTPLGIWAAAAVLAFLLLAAAAPQVFMTHDPYAVDPAAAFAVPGAEHLFGTDQNGRDVFSRVVAGAGQSLLIGFTATAIGLTLGGLLGITAGVMGRFVDTAISRAVEVLFAFPGLLLALIVIAISGTGVITSAVAVGIGTAPGYARMLRTQTLQVVAAPYVETAHALGRSPAYTLWRTVIPNVVRPLLVLATLGVGQAVVWASSLSFLGLGAQPPAAEWGAMLADGRSYIQIAWWIAVFPGLFITLASLTTTVVGRYAQRLLEGQK